MARTWSPDSWHTFPAEQQPAWPDDAALLGALKQVSAYPPLVFAGEARNLQVALGHVAAGNFNGRVDATGATVHQRNAAHATALPACEQHGGAHTFAVAIQSIG